MTQIPSYITNPMPRHIRQTLEAMFDGNLPTYFVTESVKVKYAAATDAPQTVMERFFKESRLRTSIINAAKEIRKRGKGYALNRELTPLYRELLLRLTTRMQLLCSPATSRNRAWYLRLEAAKYLLELLGDDTPLATIIDGNTPLGVIQGDLFRETGQTPYYDLTQENEELASMNEELTNQNEMLTRQNEELTQQNEWLANRLERQVKWSERQFKRNHELTQQNEKLTCQNQELTSQVEELEKRLNNLPKGGRSSAILNLYKQRAEMAEQSVAELEQEVNSLKEQLKEVPQAPARHCIYMDELLQEMRESDDAEKCEMLYSALSFLLSDNEAWKSSMGEVRKIIKKMKLPAAAPTASVQNIQFNLSDGAQNNMPHKPEKK